MTDRKTLIIGGGPAGSVAALCLRRLGREVELLERVSFPRYSVGESLIPGTLSILCRLGVLERIQRAQFVRKAGATFLWGKGHRPWTFLFDAPKEAPWVFDHAYQVNRAEFDAILLEAAKDAGAIVREGREVVDVGLCADAEGAGASAIVAWKEGPRRGSYTPPFVIDASGRSGVFARRLGLRQSDEYFRNFALWSYFKGGKRLGGDLAGNVLSVTFDEGWIWVIPLKDDVCSVGVITDKRGYSKHRRLGPDAFYHRCLESAPQVAEMLKGATNIEKVRVARDWAYDSTRVALGRVFLCGDAAFFIDPLFSQGIHLAVYSSMLAASAIDRMIREPGDAAEINAWYGDSYRELYNRYHRFLTAFYSMNSSGGSGFWANRKVREVDDRLLCKDWFRSLTDFGGPSGESAIEGLESRAVSLAHLWQHAEARLTEQVDHTDLSLRRMRWASDFLRRMRSMVRVRWASKEVCLVSSFAVEPTTFRLERHDFLADEQGRILRNHPVTREHVRLFRALKAENITYRILARELARLSTPGRAFMLLRRLFEEGFLWGWDANGAPVELEIPLQFAGVGSGDDYS